MREWITRNWHLKLIMLAALAFTLRGFLARIVDPVAAAMHASVNPTTILVAEIVVLAPYTLGLFAFPAAFWRRAFKFVCLMGAYMLLGPVLRSVIGSAGASGTAMFAAASSIAGHALAVVAGYIAYRRAWPLLEPHAPSYNPAA